MTRGHTCEAEGGCDQTTPAHLCGAHFTELLRALRGVGRLTPELRVTLTRQAVSSAVGDSTSDAGLPYAEAAADLYWIAGETLRVWAFDVARIVGYQPAYPDRTAHLAGWHIAHRQVLRHLPDIAQMHDETRWLARTMRTAIYGPGPLQSLGPCDTCGRALGAAAGQAAVTCPGCGAVYDVPTRRRALLSEAKEQLLTATELSRVMPELLGDQLAELKTERIRKWASRGRLVQRPGRRYRVGDVLTLLNVELST
ncbi:hypothetical protein [Pseudonocardia sp. WMMC193]|uniref:hypothetical protein n=1 Tax=Pseudonocardia sp. WMMC193 TaxID=2911965 RepID=UPI001F2E7C3E|nr:hypothetical protein [Pseudonocardia sp. WMMC193]MCF7550990.1 hypothetical protein [Pseudonocardia sp. WMMC193]